MGLLCSHGSAIGHPWDLHGIIILSMGNSWDSRRFTLPAHESPIGLPWVCSASMGLPWDPRSTAAWAGSVLKRRTLMSL